MPNAGRCISCNASTQPRPEVTAVKARPTPRQAVPPLQAPLLGGGGRYDLTRSTPDRFSLIVVYRGRHCPACCAFLASLARQRHEFARRGVQVIAISADSLERATHTREKCGWRSCQSAMACPPRPAATGACTSRPRRQVLHAPIEDPPIFAKPGLYSSNQTAFFTPAP